MMQSKTIITSAKIQLIKKDSAKEIIQSSNFLAPEQQFQIPLKSTKQNPRDAKRLYKKGILFQSTFTLF